MCAVHIYIQIVLRCNKTVKYNLTTVERERYKSNIT